MADISKIKLPSGSTVYNIKDANAIHSSDKGVANGVAELDSTGKVPSSQLPAYVDDVVEGYYYNGKFYSDSAHTQEIEGESGKIYVDLHTNKTYRWSGSTFVEISASLALGETSTTAYRGDRGKTAYDHSQLTSGNPHSVTASDVGIVANPTPTGTEPSLTTLTIGSTSYRIEGSGGGGGATIVDLTVAGWQGSAAPYTQAITITGITATEVPFIVPYVGTAVTDVNNYYIQFDQITKCTVTANTLTFECQYAKPTIALQAMVKRG